MRNPGNREWAPLAVMLALAAGALLCSCGKEDREETGAASFAIKKTYERGPVTVRLKIDRDEITIADRITLVLEAEAEEQYEVEMPSFGEKLDQFGIVDYHSPSPRLTDENRVLYTKEYELEPFLSGDYTVPPMTVAFWEKDAGQDADEDGEEPKKHKIETEEVKIKVTSLLPEKAAELKIKDIAGPVELPKPDRRWLYWVLAGAVVAAGAGGGLAFWLKGRSRDGTAVPTIPAHELAYRRLETLVGEDLIEDGRFKEFYRRVSDILRHYIENRFGLHAPERTTEEFLDELRRDDALSSDHRRLLEDFLGHCDLVKFAELKPGKPEIQKTFDACKRFISETQSDGASVPLDAAA